MKNAFLLSMAIGDAYGMRFEFVEHDCNLRIDDLYYMPHPTYEKYQVAHYTDDTQMSLANAELLLSFPEQLNRDDFINSWLNAYRRDPREGYSRYMQEIMSTAVDADNFCAKLRAYRGVTSGAAMRAGVFGLLPDIDLVKNLVEKQARITHDTTAGVNAALAVALGIHFLHHCGKRKDINMFIEHHLSSTWNSSENGYTDDPNNGLNIITQMLSVVCQPASLSQSLLNAANYAPLTDTDTLCALTLQLSSRDQTTLDDLPLSLYSKLEDGPYGKSYLNSIDKNLIQAYARKPLYGPATTYKPTPLEPQP